VRKKEPKAGSPANIGIAHPDGFQDDLTRRQDEIAARMDFHADWRQTA